MLVLSIYNQNNAHYKKLYVIQIFILCFSIYPIPYRVKKQQAYLYEILCESQQSSALCSLKRRRFERFKRCSEHGAYCVWTPKSVGREEKKSNSTVEASRSEFGSEEPQSRK